MRIVTQQEQDRRKDGARAISLTPDRLRRWTLWGIAALVLLIALFTCFYTTNEQETAVVTTFGRVTAVQERSGFHLKAPFGIQKVSKVPVIRWKNGRTLS